MVIKAYKLGADGTRSIVELEVSDNWYPEPVTPEDQALELSEISTIDAAAKEIRTISILSNKKAGSIAAAK